jgi:hypothetical protein
MVCTCSFKSSILFLYSYLAFTEKTLSPSIVVVNHSTNCRFNNIIHIVNAEAVSSNCLPICFNIDILPPVIGSAYKSFTPSVPSSVFFNFVPKLRWYLNLPHKFYAHVCSNSCRSIFIRLTVKPLTPICSLLFISSMISLLVPALHSLWGWQNDCFQSYL